MLGYVDGSVNTLETRLRVRSDWIAQLVSNVVDGERVGLALGQWATGEEHPEMMFIAWPAHRGYRQPTAQGVVGSVEHVLEIHRLVVLDGHETGIATG